ncbi:hypothetical protein HZQ69_07445 [Elizabethkingia anophelis]|nr:hypothetical protein [Elizabethkingia anophelis]
MNNILAYSIVIYLLLNFLSQSIRIAFYYKKFYFEYFSGKKVSWNIKHDRLLVLMSIAFPMLSLYLIFESFHESRWYVIIIYILAITMFTALLFLMFYHADREVEKNEKSSIPVAKQEIQDIQKYDFKLNYTKDELKQIYQKMIDNSFIESLVENHQMNDDDYFVDILYNGKLPERTVFKLNFDNIQTKVFWDYLQSRDIGEKREFKLSLDKFSKIFQNNNGEIKVKSVFSSTSKASTRDAKKSEIIISLFDFEK